MRDITPCTPGTIALDGTEISHFSEQALRDSICLVSQRVDLFHDSLAKKFTPSQRRENRIQAHNRITTSAAGPH